jgi:2-keto-3-deoxy-L-rhamnonate aldolase RhmA
MDLGVVGILVVVASLFGLPWIVAATVHSLNHVKSLSTEVKVADGAAPSSVVTENRVSGLLIHLLIGCSIFLLPLVKAIPMEVLFGLFLFMG